MIPNIFFIFPLLEILDLGELYINEYLDNDFEEEDVLQILSFMNILPMLLELLVNIFHVTKDTSRENDAYKLIRYFAEYR